MSDLQLERSVLEAKERDELFAIATALGSAPAPRTKKADLVTQILQVTGVEEVPPEKARRPRARRSSTKDGPGGDEAAGQLPLGTGSEASPAASTNGHSAPSAPLRTRGRQSAPKAPVGTSAPADALELADGSAVPNAQGAASELSSRPAGDGSAPRASGQVAPGGAEAVAPPEGVARPEGVAPSAEPQGFEPAEGAAQVAARPEFLRGRTDGDVGLGNSRRRRRRNRDKPGRGLDRAAERELASQPEVPYTGELVAAAGLLDLRDEGYGFLRTSGYLASPSDVYVSINLVRRFGLRKGDWVEGAYRPASSNEKYPALVRVDSVSGLAPDDARNRPKFESLTPLFPDEKLRLELPGDPANVTARIVDLISPIGKGQRGLIVSPPKAGKTTVLKQIAHSIEANNPEVYLMVLLVDERPEEVTDMRRSVKGEVV